MTQLQVEKKKETASYCIFEITRNGINILVFQAIAVIIVFIVNKILTYSNDTLFNLHVCFNSIGFVMLMSEAIMLHSTDQLFGVSFNKAKKSKLHGFFIGIGTLMAIIGISINIITRKVDRHPHFSSAHGIAGLVSLILIILACLAGLFSIQWEPIKKLIKIPLVWWKIVHTVCGSLGYIAGVVAVCLGYYTWFFELHANKDERLACTIVTALIAVWVTINPLLTMFRHSKTIASNL